MIYYFVGACLVGLCYWFVVWYKDTHYEALKTYATGGGWGNSIVIEKWPPVTEAGQVGRVHGFKSRIPVKCDRLLVGMLSGRVIEAEFTKVEQCNDPKDMFFADFKIKGYLDINSVDNDKLLLEK